MEVQTVDRPFTQHTLPRDPASIDLYIGPTSATILGLTTVKDSSKRPPNYLRH